MKRKKVWLCVSLICVVNILSGCGQMFIHHELEETADVSENMKNIEEVYQTSDIDDELEQASETLNIETIYQTFDWDSVQKELAQIPETKMDFVELNETINTGTIYAEYQGNFPKELVEEFEKLLIQNSKAGRALMDNDDYYKVLKKYGCEKYMISLGELKELYPEIEECKEEIDTVYAASHFCEALENCFEIFSFVSEENRKFYLYVYDYGGTAGYCYAVLKEKVGDEILPTGVEFDMQNEGGGRLICYEGDYYFVFMQSNYRLKCGDGIRIYKVGPDATEADNALIRCVPEEFVWENDVMATDDIAELSSYIAQTAEKIVDKKYIETGDTQGAWFSYGMEDETKIASEFPLNTEKQRYQKMDFANMNVPIYYMTKVSMVESYPPELNGEFYLYDGEEILELSKYWMGKSYYGELVQMWFHEIDDKVYTFQIFHLEGYNYMLAVRLVEGNNVTTIRCDHIIPKFCFEITEGKEMHVG